MMLNRVGSNNYLVAICRCVDVLLSNNADEEQTEKAQLLIKALLKNIMPYLREEPQACEIADNIVESVNKLTEGITDLPSSVFVKSLCDKTGVSKDIALISIIPALCRVLADALSNKYKDDDSIQQNIEEIQVLKKKLSAVVDIFCKGESTIVASKQLSFIVQLFCIEPIEYIGDNEVQSLVDIIMREQTDISIQFTRKQVEDIVYRSFNKLRLSHLIEYYKKYSKKSEEKLNELGKKYDLGKGDTIVDDPFYIEKSERLRFIKGLQKYTLEALVLTRDFLQEQGLRFYLAEGTLLGAVRHNGFIPWDDDVDIVMPREDYDRLVELAKAGKIPPELYFDSLETNKKHWVLGAKMQLTRPCEYIQPKVQKLSKYCGPYVDIFPMDYWNKPYAMKNRIADMCVKSARRMLFMKTGFSKITKKKPHRMAMRLLCLALKNEWIEKFAIKNMKRFYNGNRKYLVNLCSYYPYYKEVFPTSFFGEAVYVDFEGEKMPIPCEYDYILKTVYGRNYDTVPPIKVTNMRNHAFVLRENN